MALFSKKKKKTSKKKTAKTKSDPPGVVQVVVKGRITPTRSGGEVIVFQVNIFHVIISAIVTIPPDGTETGPVYLKIDFRRFKDALRMLFWGCPW